MVSRLGWKDSYSIGVSEVDEQHKRLFELFEKIDRALGNEGSEYVVGEAMRELVVYVTEHFRDEERLMRRIDYARLEGHVKAHRAFVGRIVAYLKALKGGRMITADDLAKFLHGWLVDHVLGEDMKLAAIVRARTHAAQRVE